MLTVLSANENLLERLELLIQNRSRPLDNEVKCIALDDHPEQRDTHKQHQQQHQSLLVRAHSVLLSADTNGMPSLLPISEIGGHRTRMAQKDNGNDDNDTADDVDNDANIAPPFCTKWMVLMAKKNFNEHQITLQTLGDLCRLSLAMRGTMMKQQLNTNGNNNNKNSNIRNERNETVPPMQILIVKKEHADDDEHCLHQHMELVKQEWSEQWGAKAMDKMKRFGESAARREQTERAKHWRMADSAAGNGSLPHCRCAIAYFDDPNLLTVIYEFFQLDIDTSIEMVENVSSNNADDSSDTNQRHQLFTKPPALHWTNYPRESEVQVTFKFAFPKGTVSEWLFREWIGNSRQLLVWDYEYEWTNGIFLRADELVKITITRVANEPHIIELSGRIDMDEAAEEDQLEVDEQSKGENHDAKTEGNAAETSPPLQRVWPYLMRIFAKILADLDSRKTLPFNLSFVFIGDLFFYCPKGAPKITARSLDAFQTLSSIECIKTVNFRADQEQIYSLNLEQCFPNFHPIRLTDLCNPHKFQLPSRVISPATECGTIRNMSQSEVITMPPTSLAAGITRTSILPTPKGIEKVRVDRSSSCAPVLANSTDATENKGENDNNNERKAEREENPVTTMTSAQSLHVERQLGGYKNRGRRVSFGVIHSIPSPQSDNTSGRSSPGGFGTGGGSNNASPSPLLGGSITNRWFNNNSMESEQQMMPSSNRKTNNTCYQHPETESGNCKGNGCMDSDWQRSSNGTPLAVENIVDEMLQDVMNEAVVMKRTD